MSIASNPLDILAIADVETEDVAVPEWGVTVRVRSISAAEREELLKGSVVVEGKTRKFDPPAMRVKIVWMAVVDEQGRRVFTTQEQLRQLGTKNANAVDHIADVAMRLAGIGDDEDDAGKAPSPTTTSDSSTD